MRKILLPTLWKYIFIEYYKLFFAILFYFISLILILKLQDIAHFITLRSSNTEILLFILYQVPYILPFAIPLSCLLATFLVLYRLSTSQEITALQTSGTSIKAIHIPFIWIGILTFLCNLFINFEITPCARQRTKSMITELVQSNPFLMLQKKQYFGEKNHIVRSNYGETGNDLHHFFFFGKTTKNQLYGIFSDTVTLDSENLEAYNLATITSFPGILGNDFPTLYLENQKKISIPISQFSSLFVENAPLIAQEDLSTKTILTKIVNSIEDKKNISRGMLELIKRLSFAISSFTLLLIGISYGLQTSSTKKSFNLIMCCLLTSSIFCSFLIAKSFEKRPLYAYYFYFIPHIFIIISYFYKKNIRSNEIVEKKFI